MVRGGWGGDRWPQTDKHMAPSTFTGQFFKKSRHLGFGVSIDILSMRQDKKSRYLLLGKDYSNPANGLPKSFLSHHP